LDLVICLVFAGNLQTKNQWCFAWFFICQLLLIFCDGSYAGRTDFRLFSVDPFALQIYMLPFDSFNIRVRTAGAFSRTAAADITFFSHKILVFSG